jgi:hypothetical protein
MTTHLEDLQDDPLNQYVRSVHGLHSKLARISANQQDVAASLGRAAAALRSLGELSKPKSPPVFGK